MTWLPKYMLPPPAYMRGPAGPYAIIGQGPHIQRLARTFHEPAAPTFGDIRRRQEAQIFRPAPAPAAQEIPRNGALRSGEGELRGDFVLVMPPYALTPGAARSTQQIRDGSRYILATRPVRVTVLDRQRLGAPEPVGGATDLMLIRYAGPSLSADLRRQFNDVVTGWVNSARVFFPGGI
jgi:hypothetical protein